YRDGRWIGRSDTHTRRQARPPKCRCRERSLSSPSRDRDELHAKIGNHVLDQARFFPSQVAPCLLLKHSKQINGLSRRFEVDRSSTSHWALDESQVHRSFYR